VSPLFILCFRSTLAGSHTHCMIIDDTTSVAEACYSKLAIVQLSFLPCSVLIKQFAEWIPNFLRAQNIMAGFGFPRKYGTTPVTFSIGATKAPHAGTGPLRLDPVKS
jgi:hypothetical protein